MIFFDLAFLFFLLSLQKHDLILFEFFKKANNSLLILEKQCNLHDNPILPLISSLTKSSENFLKGKKKIMQSQ